MAKRRRLTDPELRRARDMAFARLSAQGWTQGEIAQYHRVTDRYVRMRLAALPPEVRERAASLSV